MNLTKTYENYITALMLVAVMCFAFFAVSVTAVHAEEDFSTDKKVVSDENEAKRTEMKKQIDELRAVLESRKEEFKEKQEETKKEFKEKQEERKTEFKADKVEFMASLEGLDEDEKKAVMMDFIQNLQSIIEANKVEMKEKIEERKEEFKEKQEEYKVERDEFRSSLDGLTREEKIAAIMQRVAELKDKFENNEDEAGF